MYVSVPFCNISGKIDSIYFMREIILLAFSFVKLANGITTTIALIDLAFSIDISILIPVHIE